MKKYFLIIFTLCTFLFSCEETPTYLIVFNSGGGEGQMPSQFFATYKETKLDKCAFVKKGYSFDGWKYGTEKLNDE